jgi:hypothetical protein
MAEMAAEEDAGETEVLVAADALLSDRLEFSCMVAENVAASRYRQWNEVGNSNMSEAN